MKLWNCKGSLYPKNKFSKIVLIMKLTSFFLFILLLPLNAVVYTQEVKVTLDFEQITLRGLLDEIEKKTNYRFLYEDDLLDLDRTMIIDYRNEPVDDVINDLVEANSLEYVVIDDNLIVFKKIKSKQQVEIRGKITNANGEPLPGVNVVEKGTINGAVSDLDGNYSISVGSTASTLVFSFVGFLTEEIDVGSNSVINLTMIEDIKALDEVVVIGYGSVKKSDLTGSVASVSAEELQRSPMPSLDQGLRGRVSGVQVTRGSSAPGGGISIRIRGGNSINSGNEPLYVIDGFPIYSDNSASAVPGSGNARKAEQNALSSINPNDIESIEILKDASATAIYGARGANGVILVTTKRGKKGTSEINYNAYYGIQKVSRIIPVLNAHDFAAAVFEGLENDGYDLSRGGEITSKTPEEWEAEIGEGTNWQKELFVTAPMQNHQISASGGSENIQYLVSGNYFDQDGIITNTGFKRYSLRTNIDAQINNKLTVGSYVTFSHTQSEQGLTEFENSFGGNGLVAAALMNSPLVPVYEEDGSYTWYQDWRGYGRYNMNVVADAENTKDLEKRNRLLGTIFANYEFIEGLSLKVSFGADLQGARREIYLSRGTRTGRLNDGYSSHGYKNINSLLNENILTFTRTFNDIHQLNAMGGMTLQSSMTTSDEMAATGFINDNLEDNELSAATNFDIPNSSKNKWSIASWLARVNYTLKEKYMLTVSGRADGSSRFGANNKWAFFPSAAVAWRISNEPFLQDLIPQSNVKLRLSYGVTGNAKIPLYQSLSRLKVTNYNLNGDLTTGFEAANIANPELKWETTEMYDVGIDIGFLANRITFTADYYQKYTDDLLLDATVPYTTGFSTIFRNVGSMKHEGAELGIDADILVSEFKWNTNITWSRNRSKILDIGESDPFTTESIGNGQDGAWIQEGAPIGAYRRYLAIGLVRTEDMLDLPNRTNKPATLGNTLYLDTNGDRTVDGEDQMIVSTAQPDFFWSCNNNFSWKGFDLNIYVYGIKGGSIINSAFRRMEGGSARGANLTQRSYDDAWRPDNVDGAFVRMHDGQTNGVSGESRQVFDGSFIRLQNVSLGYNIPSNKVFKNARVYVSGQNLHVWTDYYGYDPEVNSAGQDHLLNGVDNGSYPATKSVTFGVNVTF